VLRARPGRGKDSQGHPGSGKTTALLHAAASLAERVLYLTFSQDLAGLARDYFDRFCSGSRTFRVFTYPEFLRQLLRGSAVQADVAESRAQFRRDLWNHQRAWFVGQRVGCGLRRSPLLWDCTHFARFGASRGEAV
jgi:hypothetical protein